MSVYIFWDNSNIFIGAKYVAARQEGTWAEDKVRIHFESLYDLARAGREVSSAYSVGSVPPELRAVWDRIRELGVEVELLERGEQSGTEQGVDEALQVQMLRTLHDIDPPETVVLVTGDGAGFVDGVGFHADLQRMADAGWNIEVMAWELSCANALQQWAEKVGAFVRLEDFYRSITFIEGLRRYEPLNLSRRPRSD